MNPVRQRIQEYWLEIKGLADLKLAEWGLFAVVALVGIGAFGLGRLSALEELKPPVSIGQAPRAIAPRALAAGGLIVASKKGSAYYFPWCAGAQKISPSNAVWFSDEASAIQAGYQSSKSCKGLSGQ